MSFWRHLIAGYAILLIPFAAIFILSFFVSLPDIFDIWPYIPPAFGAIWIALFFIWGEISPHTWRQKAEAVQNGVE